MYIKDKSVFQSDHNIIQGMSAFQSDHIDLEIFGFDPLPDQPCCWIKILLPMMLKFITEIMVRVIWL